MPKKTTEIIIDSGNNYTIGVKENQPTLLKNIKDIISSEKPTDFIANIEKNRGRIELRETTVFDAPKFLAQDWKGIKKIIKVDRTTKRDEKVSEESAYFISSSFGDAEYFNRGIRLHWGIENSLHYIKDVVFGEDDSQIKKDNSPENNSIIRNIVINVFREKLECNSSALYMM
ncbi:MAG TPA: ISAs1 family transposase [Campylobacterales bacterium]|nr:ISAs1 family transposase [Campylobacterales bacterium]HHH54587.1 ISAs1 family transposase [Bacteroidota bacterium]